MLQARPSPVLGPKPLPFLSSLTHLGHGADLGNIPCGTISQSGHMRKEPLQHGCPPCEQRAPILGGSILNQPALPVTWYVGTVAAREEMKTRVPSRTLGNSKAVQKAAGVAAREPLSLCSSPAPSCHLHTDAPARQSRQSPSPLSVPSSPVTQDEYSNCQGLRPVPGTWYPANRTGPEGGKFQKVPACREVPEFSPDAPAVEES